MACLRMAAPWKDPVSGVFYLRVRVPLDLANRVAGSKIALPLGERTVEVRAGQFVKMSLRTKEPREARTLFLAANHSLTSYWDALRTGPARLNHKQSVALAGEIYVAWTKTLEDDPGSMELWDRVLQADKQARLGNFGRGSLIIGDEALKKRRSMEERFGPMTDLILRKHGLVVDAESRSKLIEQVAIALTQAAERLKGLAEGDYSPDENARRFPAFDKPNEQTTALEPKAGLLTMTAMLEAWEAEAMRLGRANATARRYGSVFKLFRAFLGHDDATTVTDHDVIRYKEHRLEAGISGKTFKDADLSALKSVFGWAVENKLLTANPAAGVKVRVAKRKVSREKGFTEEEALLILKAAKGYVRTGKESRELAVAKRWVPWLCAFTGARVAEITSLSQESFSLNGTVPTVRIFDGSKGLDYRDVPLHPQLIELGLLEFVKDAPKAPLFHSSARGKRNGADTVATRIGSWVRSLGITDARVQPNHGWRHRFTTVARAVGMDHEKREYILGHRLPGLGWKSACNWGSDALSLHLSMVARRSGALGGDQSSHGRTSGV